MPTQVVHVWGGRAGRLLTAAAGGEVAVVHQRGKCPTFIEGCAIGLEEDQRGLPPSRVAHHRGVPHAVPAIDRSAATIARRACRPTRRSRASVPAVGTAVEGRHKRSNTSDSRSAVDQGLRPSYVVLPRRLLLTYPTAWRSRGSYAARDHLSERRSRYGQRAKMDKRAGP